MVKKIVSGVNDTRPNLMKLLNQNDYKILLIENIRTGLQDLVLTTSKYGLKVPVEKLK